MPETKLEINLRLSEATIQFISDGLWNMQGIDASPEEVHSVAQSMAQGVLDNFAVAIIEHFKNR